MSLGSIIGAFLQAFIKGPLSPADLDAALTRLAAQNPQKLDWRHSIVDLMKLTGQDSSLAARKSLAAELGYTGALNGSAEMNIWLHQQVMSRLARSLPKG